MHRAIIATLFGFALTANAATNAASSGAWSDVSNAVYSAQSGDVVTIPAGSNQWSGVILVNKAVSIFGAGTNVSTGTVIRGAAFVLKPGTNAPVRLTGIHFWQADWSTGYIVTLIGDCRQFRVDRCMFTRGHHGLAFGIAGYGATGPAYGVVDHNTFFNVNVSCYVADIETGDTLDGDAAWARGYAGAYAPGTTNTICVEDNLFLTDSEISNEANNNNQHLYGWSGARATFRNNRQVATGSGVTSSIDGHGEYDSSRSIMLFEVYSNTFHIVNSPYPFSPRGGVWIMHGNTVTNGASPGFLELANEHNVGDATTGILTNSFWWGNTLNGSAVTGPFPVNDVYPYTGSMNTHYFLRAPQNGDVWHPYIPLAYPHPLVTAQDGIDPEVSPPGDPQTNAPTGSAHSGVLRARTVRIGRILMP